MSDEAPKEIWVNTSDREDGCCPVEEEKDGDGKFYDELTADHYTLTDHAIALVAEAYEVAAKAAFERVFDDMCQMKGTQVSAVERLCSNLVRDVRTLTPADALAAREARDKQVREEALTAAALIDRKIKAVQPEMSRRAQRLAEGKKAGFQYAIHRADLDARLSDRDVILALIEKDKTNE